MAWLIDMSEEIILSINSGSSSLKLAFFALHGGEETMLLHGTAEDIGRASGSMYLQDESGTMLLEEAHTLETQQQALSKLVSAAQKYLHQTPSAIGHRIVHGGPKLTEHQRLTPAVLNTLRESEHFAPLHIPEALALIHSAETVFPSVPMYACFDTAFHRTLPAVARRFPLSKQFDEQGIYRYGFHGLSYESIVHRLGEELPSRVVLAHLGNGSSLCAVRDGISVDTSMGLTPTGGIPMATRTGDIDPGVLLFLMRSTHKTADGLEHLFNNEAGLKAISGGEWDMRALVELSRAGDVDASLTIEIFAMAVRKTIAAYAAVLGGIDLLVFAGGIGEHSTEVREKICEGLGFLGLSASKNIRVIHTEEEAQMARIVRRLHGQRPVESTS